MAKGFDGWFEIFRAGEHIDASGNKKVWTVQELEGIVKNYNAAEHEAPIVIGHPKDNAPAFGWVESLKLEGKSLYAKGKDLVAEFKEAVEKGLYKKRSISLYPGLKLRHIGFLGAMPPAVKGLADIQFSSEAGQVCETYEFSDAEQVNYKFDNIGRLFQKVRDYLIEKESVEVADGVLPQWWLEEIKQKLRDDSPEAIRAFCEAIIQEKSKMTKENTSNTEFAEKLQVEADKNKELQDEINALRQQKRQDEFLSFCEELVKKGNVTPAQKELSMKIFEAATSPESYEFSEDGKQPLLDAVKALLQSLHKQVEFGEVAKKTRATDFSEQGEDSSLAEKIANASKK